MAKIAKFWLNLINVGRVTEPWVSDDAIVDHLDVMKHSLYTRIATSGVIYSLGDSGGSRISEIDTRGSVDGGDDRAGAT